MDTQDCTIEVALAEALKAFTDDFNSSQIRVITEHLGKIKWETITKYYLNSDIPYAVLHYILMGIANGFNMDKYIVGYAPDQINEIYLGLLQNLEVDLYDNPKLTATDMGFIRHALVVGLPMDDIEHLVSVMVSNKNKQISKEENDVRN
jgi:hypothetical protein